MSLNPWSHQNKEWQETLDLARRLGFPPPKALNDHGGLELECPGRERAHRIRIYSTGKGTESVARSSRTKIRNCQHRDVRPAVDRIERSLDAAERWIEAAEVLQALQSSATAIEDLLENVEFAKSQLADVERTFDELYEDLARLTAEREAAVAKLGADAAQFEPGDMAKEASGELRTAKLVARDELPKLPPVADPHLHLRSRLGELQSRVAALNNRNVDN